MKFGYFTLSDNHYADNTRTPNQFVADIIDEALYAETLECTRRGSASITSARWACCLVPISPYPISPHARSAFAWHPQ
jgi:hypothetical protein